MIKSKPATKEYRDNFDIAFKRKKTNDITSMDEYHEGLRELEKRNHVDDKQKKHG